MSDTNAQGAAPEPRKIEGIGGWLIIPLLNLVFAFVVLTLFVLLHASDILAPPPGTWGDDIFASGEFFLGTFLLLTAALAGYSIFCLVRVFQKKRAAPGLMIVFFILTVVWGIANAAGLWLFGSDQELDANMSNDLKGLVQSILPAAIWIAYLRNSVRVKNTFVR